MAKLLSAGFFNIFSFFFLSFVHFVIASKLQISEKRIQAFGSVNDSLNEKKSLNLRDLK